MKIFSGSSNQELANSVAKNLGINLSEAEITRFKTSEVRIRILEDVKDQVCVIIQSTSNPVDENLMELFLFADALYRQEARKIIGVIPYFGYARQDIQHRPGECVSANVVIRFLETLKFSKVYTVNLHDEATEGVFSIPFKNISALEELAKAVKKYLEKGGIKVNPETVAVVSPDQGGIERARKFGDFLFEFKPFAAALTEKKRNLEGIHDSKAVALYGDVKDKICVIVDDIVTSGRTLINSANLCIEHGARAVLAAVVHRDFTNETPELIQNSNIEKFFTTNTIKIPGEYRFPKLEEISVANIISQELKSFL